MNDLEDLINKNERTVRPLYEQNGHAYHNFDHAKFVESRVKSAIHFYGFRPEDAAAARIAALWHDAIYDPAAKDNETKSAEALMRLAPEPSKYWRIYTVAAAAVEATTHRSYPYSMIAAVVCDADLGGLASDWKNYKTNAFSIKSEYASVGFTDEDWFYGRFKFIDAMLEKPFIYLTSYFAPGEERARLQLTTERQHLLNPTIADEDLA